jgi:hypothetical protein
MAERTGCPILSSLWSYVTVMLLRIFISQIYRARSKRTRVNECIIISDRSSVRRKDKKDKNIQQQVFAGGHPRNY